VGLVYADSCLTDEINVHPDNPSDDAGGEVFVQTASGGGTLSCEDAADANDDGTIDVSDAVKLLLVLFRNDPMPPGTIFGQPQEDPTPDNLGCQLATWRFRRTRATRGSRT
jgi:hypothetical protein